MTKRQYVSAQRVRELLNYDAETGKFTWLVANSIRVKVGDQAGSLDHKGYVGIRIDRVLYMAHRLAWLYSYGVWPEEFLDHINQIKGDNRLCNLREVTDSQNKQNVPARRNNTSGYKGVSWNKRSEKWEACIGVNGRKIKLGYHMTAEDAHIAYKNAALKYHTHNPESSSC